MIGAERPRLVPTQWFRPGSRRLVLLTRQSVSQAPQVAPQEQPKKGRTRGEGALAAAIEKVASPPLPTSSSSTSAETYAARALALAAYVPPHARPPAPHAPGPSRPPGSA